ncbi:MAG: ORF6N domain-containing protein [Arcobacteraceae bacterium]|nr:ORF6N domain-containing protein [Arcobacteraceae bacterium]
MNLTVQEINSKIYEVRGMKVMLDSDLAKLYQVETRDLNKAVFRNIKRFPLDFMFELTKEEFENLMFQNGTSSWGGRRKLPKVFTEQGIAMLSSVLRSDIAIEVNISIMRTFVALRKYALTHDELAKRLEELEAKVEKGEQVDRQILDVLTQLISEEKTKKSTKKIGFV